MTDFNPGWAIAIQRRDTYRWLSALFLTLPDAEFVASVIRMDEATEGLGLPETPAAIGEGIEALRRFAAQSAARPLETVLQEVGVDRTRLIRGTSPDHGPAPPYEWVYATRPIQEVHAEVLDLYRRANLSVSADLHEPPDHLGVELRFMAELCYREAEALLREGGEDPSLEGIIALEKTFLSDHLGPWVPAYAEEMGRHARTDLYRGVAQILGGFIEAESQAAMASEVN